MSRPPIQFVELTEHLSMAECHPCGECRHINWNLYDERPAFNIGFRKPTRDAAFIAAIEYWAARALKAEKELADLSTEVDAFVNKVRPVDPPDPDWN